MNLLISILMAFGLLVSSVAWSAGVTIEMSTEVTVDQVTYTDDGSETQNQIETPDESLSLADFSWGIEIDRVGAVPYPGGLLTFNPEVLYEYGRRINYSPEIESISDFWKDCIGTIGQQGNNEDQCKTDENLNTPSEWHLLGSTLESQGALIKTNLTETHSVSEPPENPDKNNEYIKGEFNFSDTSSLSMEGIYQMGYRHAIQFSWEGDVLDFKLQDIQLTNAETVNFPGLSVDSSVILRVTAYPSSEIPVQCAYRGLRILLQQESRYCETHFSASFEIQSHDGLSDEALLSKFDREEQLIYEVIEINQSAQFDDMVAHIHDRYENQQLKVILHYEVQHLITNTNLLTEYNPMDFMGRPSLLVSEKDESDNASGGSVFYIIMLLLISLRSGFRYPVNKPG